MADPTPSPQRAIQAIHERRAAQASLQAGGRPPFDGTDIEPRVQKLEQIAVQTVERLGGIEKDLAVIRSNYATQGNLADVRCDLSDVRGDLARMESALLREINAQTLKLMTFVCGFGTALVTASFFVARYVR